MEKEVVYQGSADDEINLVDLILMLWERKWLILGSFVIFVAAGLGYALYAPEVYEYSTVIEVGTTLKNVENGDPVIIEEPASLLEKIKSSYAPVAVHTFSDEGATAIVRPKIAVSSPKNSRLIVMKSRGKKKSEEDYHLLHNLLTAAIEKDHLAVISSARRELSSKVVDAQIVLAELEHPTLIKVAKNVLIDRMQGKKRALDELKSRQKVEILTLEAKVAGEKAKLDDLASQAQLIDVQLELTEKERLLVERQAEEVSAALAGVKTGRKLAAESVNDATKALTLMMVENQIEMQRTRLERLETRLTIDLKRQRGELSMEKAENLRAKGVQARFLKEAESALSKRAADAQLEIVAAHESVVAAENALLKFDIDYVTKISQQKQSVEQLQGRSEVLQNTRALAIAMRSAERLSPKRSLIVALSGVSGGMFGIVLAFFFSFLGQVKKRQQQITAEQD